MDMTELNDVLKHISEHITRLEQLKEESPEVREALSLMAKQEQLVKRLQEGCKENTPQVIPYPVPMYPYPMPIYPLQTWITTTGTTTHLNSKDVDQISRHLGNKLRAQMGTV